MMLTYKHYDRVEQAVTVELMRRLEVPGEDDTDMRLCNIHESPTQLILSDGAPVGFVRTVQHEVRLLHVLKSHRRRGIGRAVIADVEAAAARQDVAPWAKILPQARSFWEGVGWMVERHGLVLLAQGPAPTVGAPP